MSITYLVLKQVATVEVTKIGDDGFVASIDGVKGIYLYEVDGAPSDRPINEYTMNTNFHPQDIEHLTPKPLPFGL